MNLENLLDTRGSRLMASQSTFGLSDFLTRKAARFMPLSYGPHVPTCIKNHQFIRFSKYRIYKYEQTDRRTDGRTGREHDASC